jgi:hypothetical protein
MQSNRLALALRWPRYLAANTLAEPVLHKQ